MPDPISHAQILGSEESTNDVLFVLFIPSRDKDGNDLKDQDVWANAAGDMLSELFGGATIMPPAKGKWLNEESRTIITEEIVLVHSYARGIQANNEDVIKALGRFLHRMGKETKQGEIAVVIGDVLHRIRKFSLA